MLYFFNFLASFVYLFIYLLQLIVMRIDLISRVFHIFINVSHNISYLIDYFIALFVFCLLNFSSLIIILTLIVDWRNFLAYFIFLFGFISLKSSIRDYIIFDSFLNSKPKRSQFFWGFICFIYLRICIDNHFLNSFNCLALLMEHNVSFDSNWMSFLSNS